MYETNADVDRQILNIKLEGFLKADEAERAAAAVMGETAKLSPGFTVITDLSEFTPATAEDAGAIQNVMQLLAQKGLKRAIIVTGGKGLGKLQFDRLRTETEVPYDVVHVEDLAEAKKLIGD